VLCDVVTYIEHVKRKTSTTMDVVGALKRKVRVLYGCSGRRGGYNHDGGV